MSIKKGIKMNENQVVVFDIDGTLTDSTHRNYILESLKEIDEKYPKEEIKKDKELKKERDDLKSEVWIEFNRASKDDPPIEKTIEILKYYKSKGFKIFAMSGRADEVRDETFKYFKDLEIEFDLLKMRRKEQKIPSPYLKNAWIKKYITDKGMEVKCIYEDDQKVIDYLSGKGFTCCHVDDIKENKLKQTSKKLQKNS